MNSSTTKKVVLNGLMIALVFLATFFTRIPIPMTQGYFNIGDTVIIITAVFMGRRSGLLVGAVGSMLADVAGGYMIFAPVTFIVKGLEGYLTGLLADNKDVSQGAKIKRLVAILTGCVVMVAGYFIFEAVFLGLFDKSFGLSAAVAELPFNLLQGGISALVGYILVAILDKRLKI